MLAALVGIGEGRPHLQHSAAELHISHAVSLGVAGYFKHPGCKFAAVLRREAIAVKGAQELLHPLGFKPGAEKAGKQGPAAYHFRDVALFKAGSQIFFHRRLVAERQPFKKVLSPAAEIHTAFTQHAAKRLHHGLLAHTGQIHFCNEDKAGNFIALQKPPQGLRVSLHSVGAADHQHGIIQDLQRPLRLRREIRVPRRVEQIYRGVLKGHDGLLGENGDAPGPLQLMSVQEAVPVVYPAQLFYFSREVQHRFGQSGLSRVHMGQQSDTDMLFPVFIRLCAHRLCLLP